MEEYHKIQSVYKRDNKTHAFIEGEWTCPEFEYLANLDWVFTEKIDGTNIRIGYDGKGVTFGGRTDNAQIPAHLVNRLREMFPAEVFKDMPPLCLYGEGYGAKIQKGGGDYIPDGCDFILFDVRIDGWWLERVNVEDIATKLGIQVVPIVGRGALTKAIEMCRYGFMSELRSTLPEGLVCRPSCELLSRGGQRIITKVKLRDFF